MKRKRKQSEGIGFGVLGLIILTVSVLIGCVTENVVFATAMGLGIIFAMLFITYYIGQKKIEASGVLVNAYVTDCEQIKKPGTNPAEYSYRLMCEAADTKVYGTAEVYSETYVPIGDRIVIYYNPEQQFACPADEIITSKVDIVTLTAALICFTVAHAAYFIKKYEGVLFSQENIIRLVAGFFALCFLIMGIVFFWLAGKRKKQSVENHCYPAELVRYYYRDSAHGAKYPVWRYHCNGEIKEYESVTEKKLWQKIGSRSVVYVPENDAVFEKSEVGDSFGYGVIYLIMGIVLAAATLFFDFS